YRKGSDFMDEKSIQNIFSYNLRRLLMERNKTQLELSKYIGVSNTTINNYVKGYNMPRMDKIDKICRFFNIKRSDLLENKQVIEPPITPKTIDDLNLTGIERIAASHRDDDFTEEDLEDIQKYINFVKSKRKNDE
ncbi:helix-turn-helix domain-containing protein, partial [Parvimonas micra]|uniref:helix-turn-helix domain-containing protein n=1 Tax=Parvimonas micra TaxID=33033 RepID=UPI00241C8DFA